MMQHFKALRTRTRFAISSILGLGFVLVAFGCATSKLVSDKNQVANADFGLTAEAVSEGILLTFNNIPSDATHMWIHATSWDGTSEKRYNEHISYAGITSPSVQGWVNSSQQLEKVKQTRKVIFPIVQAGQNYHILVHVYNQREMELYRENNGNIRLRTAETECIAENGIYFDRDLIKLALNDTNSVVTLSSEPEFSSEVTFDTQKYSFRVTVFVPEKKASIGVGDHHFPNGLSVDGKTWTFEPEMTQNIKGDSVAMDWLGDGSYYTAWAESYVNIIYDDIKWVVEIAKTPEFTFSL
jgi:hypothetical protein